MAGYDGSIRINTEIDTEQANSQMMSLENRMVKTAQKAKSLTDSMDKMKNVQVPTEKYARLTKQIEQLDGKIEQYAEKIKQAKAEGASDTKIAKLTQQAEAASDKMMELADIQASMEADGTAFTTGAELNPEKYNQLDQTLQNVKRDMDAMQVKHGEMTSKMQAQADATAAKAKADATSTQSIVSKALTRIRGLILRVFIFSQITSAFNSMVSSLKEGFENLAQYSSEYNNSISQLKSAQAELKNNMAAAFAPITNWIVPALATLVGWISSACEALSRFFAVMGGKSTYTKATKQAINYAKAVKTADNAQKGALASFDDLNVLDNSSSGSGSGSGGETTGAGAFETVDIDPDTLAKLQKIKELLEAIVPFALAIAAAFAAWKIIGLLDKLMAMSPLLGTIAAAIATIAGVAIAVYNYIKMWQDGVDWSGIVGYVAGVTLAFAGLYVLFGPMAAGIELIVAGAAGLILAIADITKNGLNCKNMALLLISAMGIIIGVFISFGATAAGIVTIIALVITILAALVAASGNGQEALEWLRQTFEYLGQFVKDVFAGDFDAAFEDIKKAGKSFGNFLITVAEGVANGFVKMVNAIIDAINSIGFGPIADWVPVIGGKTFNLNIPHWNASVSFPRIALANGGITTGSTIAQIGEAGREAVLPLENNTGWMQDLADNLTQLMGGNNSAILEIDGKRFGQIVYPYVKSEGSRLGVSLSTN